MLSNLELSLICKIAGEILTFVALFKASKADVKTREVSNKFPLAIAAIFAISSFGSWFFKPETAPSSSIAAQVVFAIGIGLLLLVITVALEKIWNKELFGGADIKMIAATTLFLNTEALMVAMLVACVLFLLVSICKLKKFNSWRNVTLPFMPFWTVGFAITCAMLHFHVIS